jgi:hypothetical protein
MTMSRIRPHLLALALMVLPLLLATSARAGILLQEDFSGATPGSQYTGSIPGTQFHVTHDNVDIVGVLNGNFASSVANPTGNALDLVGGGGSGAIGSNPTFNLVAGTTYTITFQDILQGFGPTESVTSDFTVSLGSFSERLTAIPQVVTPTLTFTPLADESAVTLGFTTNTHPDTVHGAVLSNILLSSSVQAVQAVPEPSSLALAALGTLIGLAYARRRRAGAGERGKR